MLKWFGQCLSCVTTRYHADRDIVLPFLSFSLSVRHVVLLRVNKLSKCFDRLARHLSSFWSPSRYIIHNAKENRVSGDSIHGEWKICDFWPKSPFLSWKRYDIGRQRSLIGSHMFNPVSYPWQFWRPWVTLKGGTRGARFSGRSPYHITLVLVTFDLERTNSAPWRLKVDKHGTVAALRYSNLKRHHATLKSGSGVTQGHQNWYYSTDWSWFPLSVL